MRRAITGSFFAAAPAGIKPLIKVKPTLTQTIMNAERTGNEQRVVKPVSAPKIALMAKESV